MEENKKQKNDFLTSLQYKINKNQIEKNLVEIAKNEGYRIKNLTKIFFSKEFILPSIEYLIYREKDKAQNSVLKIQLQLRRKFMNFDYLGQLQKKKESGISSQFLSNMLILSRLLSKLMRDCPDQLQLSPEVIFVVLVYTATYILPSPATFFVVHRKLQNQANDLHQRTRSNHRKNGKNKTNHLEEQVDFETFRKQLQSVLKNKNGRDEANHRKKEPKQAIWIMKKKSNNVSFLCGSNSLSKSYLKPSSITQEKALLCRPLRFYSEHAGQIKGWRKENLLKHDYIPFFKEKIQEKEIKKDNKNEVQRIEIIKKNHIITQKLVFRRKETKLRL